MSIKKYAEPQVCYSVSFEYKRGDEWIASHDHRCMASSPRAAEKRWRCAGYGEMRNIVVTRVQT
jgi:hypothetical protein